MPVMTKDIAFAASWDAGNSSMNRAGRTAWNEEDYAVAVEEFQRLWPEQVEEN